MPCIPFFLKGIVMGKLSVKTKLGYGSAALGDAAVYTFTGTFLIFFFTTVAGVEPAVAGTITAIGAIFNALLNPIIGYITDNTMTRWGKRRPFMFVMAFPLLASTFLLFTAINIVEPIKPFYYGAILVIFWCSYTGYFVPYLALGAEYTNDYDERTSLRSYASFFNMLGTLIAMVGPPALVEILEKQGLETTMAWSITGFVVGTISSASIWVTVAVSKKRDKAKKEELGKKLNLDIKGIFKGYIELLTLKPMRALLFVSLAFLISYILFVSDLVYLITYNFGMSGSQASMALLVRALAGLAFIPIINFVAQRLDKRKAYNICILFVCIGATAFWILGIGSKVQLFIFIFITVIATGTYWQLVPAMYYDICEYDLITTGKMRQGAIVSFQGLTEAIASALGAQLLGLILQFAGFDGDLAVQSETALTWIENSITIVPVVFLILSLVAMKHYNIDKKNFNEIKEKMKDMG